MIGRMAGKSRSMMSDVSSDVRVQRQHENVAIGDRAGVFMYISAGWRSDGPYGGEKVQKSETPSLCSSSATAMSAAVTTRGARNRTGLKPPDCVFVVVVKLIVRVGSRPP